MLTKKMQAAMNDQIQKEMYSAYLYLAMGAYLEDQDRPGAAHWMKQQYNEEVGHAMKLFSYMTDRGGRVVLDAIDKPPTEFGSMREVFEAVLEHERKVTVSINKVYEVALAEKDYASQIELQWFVSEQVEEEKTAEDILLQLKACEDRPHLLLMIDRHLAKRGQ